MKKRVVTLSITLIMIFGLQLSAFGMGVKMKDDRILVIPCDIICRPGPNIGWRIAAIARFLHPRSFAPANAPIEKGL
ncbi:MAG: hypothetical protein GY757_36400 [bacterium]|nr:hypothetical protein [bacterium]